ncbi:MAG: gfo/Idh/MocA family oxidoreductase [Acidobacteria bacterium]|nr:gfo/Idh/MocA family oxidoreductase [Acidobacteriota bacterium]
MKRRTFFFAGAALAAASSASAQRAVAPSDRVNVGLVGVGGRGRGLTHEFLNLNDVNVAWLCDVDQASLERAQKVVDEAGAKRPPTTDDMRRVFEDRDIDAVVIATPDHWHAPATLLALEAGKDVYVEKPCSHNIREGRMMVDAARHHQRIVQMGVQRRSAPTFQRAIQMVHDGKLGKVRAAKAWDCQMRDDIGHKPDGPVPAGVDYDTYLGPAPWIPFNPNRFHYNWHWHWHFGTGDAGNDGVHHMDMARWALNVSAPHTASGMGRKAYFDDDQQTPDTMNVTLDYGEKLLLWEMRIWNPYGIEDGVENGMAVYGDDAQLQIGRWNRKEGYRLIDKQGKIVETVFLEPGEMVAHQRNFVDCVKSRELPNCDIGQGHLSTLCAHLANIVARCDRTIKFDVETETVIDDQQANLYVGRKYRTHWATPKGA